MDPFASIAAKRDSAATLSFGVEGIRLLKAVEQLRLMPYDDQTKKEISSWVQGATIGYGHLIKASEWQTYKDGITESLADNLFDTDLAPAVKAVRNSISAQVSQNEFDAMVIFAFNIGASGFSGSSVAKLVNDPLSVTSYDDLESAWKAWNKSQGQIMKGLVNRRNCEWKIFSRGIYERW